MQLLYRMRMLNASLTPGDVFQMSKDASLQALASEEGLNYWKAALKSSPNFSQVVFQLDNADLGQIDPGTLMKWMGSARITIFVGNVDPSKKRISSVDQFFTRPLEKVELRSIHYTDDSLGFARRLAAIFGERDNLHRFSLELRQAQNEDLANDLVIHAMQKVNEEA